MRKIGFILFIFIISLQVKAETDTYRAVFDCSIGDLTYIQNRLWLIQKTATMLKKDNKKYEFIITMHGQCVKILKENIQGNESEKQKIEQIQETLEVLNKFYKINIKACNIALKRLNLNKDNIVDFIQIVPNSWITLIKLQNQGFALIPFK